jgi:hypothetical protein
VSAGNSKQASNNRARDPSSRAAVSAIGLHGRLKGAADHNNSGEGENQEDDLRYVKKHPWSDEADHTAQAEDRRPCVRRLSRKLARTGRLGVRVMFALSLIIALRTITH